MNELVLQSMYFSNKKTVTVNASKFNSTELYAAFGLSPTSLPTTYATYWDYELLFRSTVVVPEAGQYKFRLQQNTEVNTDNQMYRGGRRRHTQIYLRVGGVGGTVGTLDKNVGSATVEAAIYVPAGGPVTVEASTICDCYEGIDNRFVLPNFIELDVRKEDSLHSNVVGSLDFGTRLHYLGNIEPISGDTQARIDWPDRDDPLSAGLRVSSFQELRRGTLLIGDQNLDGFVATIEAVIDAGACLSLEARRATAAAEGSIAGVALELCDVDGANQYLEFVILKYGTNGTFSRDQVGWVHASFSNPTHMRILRDPDHPTKFQVSYRPDNRQLFAFPFATASIDITGKMDVGVSMVTAESYRYAEFKNVSIEQCYNSCTDANQQQLLCGKIRTPCGKTLDCPGNCSNSDVCSDGICMKCSNVPANDPAWQCGSKQHICSTYDGRAVQVDIPVGHPPPSTSYECVNRKWACEGPSRWSWLLQGKQCGWVRDQCARNVTLWPCPNTNDLCVNHKCQCMPTVFNANFNCGWEGDGCGRNVTFGAHNGNCAAGSTCVNKACCVPLKVADFNSTFECGSEPDGCGATVNFEKSPSNGFYLKTSSSTPYTFGSAKSWGFEFKPLMSFEIDALGRGLNWNENPTSLLESTVVALWRVSDKKVLATATVGPQSSISNGYAYEPISAVAVAQGSAYRITQTTWTGFKDKKMASYHSSSTRASSGVHDGAAQYVRTAYGYGSGSYPDQSGYDYNTDFCVTFKVRENSGCGQGRFKCHSNHSCEHFTTTTTTLLPSQCGSGCCDFENRDLCGWVQSTSDNFDWTVKSGGTPSSRTGPSKAANGQVYLYIEASSPRRSGDKAILTKTVQLAAGAHMSFAYSMYGKYMGSLEVLVDKASVWKHSGDKGPDWKSATIDLSQYVGHAVEVEIVATRGRSWSSDVAIDYLSLGPTGQAVPTS